ncbi:MAG: 4-(cytidine 5'-diphospho)-2-C-methyl-D-erythritol kinase, partial [Actinomycetota bacterium]
MTRVSGPVTRAAHAKINVFLRVVGVRADGYHEIASLVAPISLSDTVTVTAAESLEVEVTGDASRTADIPVGGLNLAIVAALALGASSGGRGAHIAIDKRIPSAAGLGGGSADAAATLHALNELWSCGLGPEDLAGIAERVGSDVPALVLGGPVLVGGRGEELRPVEIAPFSWVLVHGERGVASPDAYRWWDEDGGVAGAGPAAGGGPAPGAGAIADAVRSFGLEPAPTFVTQR